MDENQKVGRIIEMLKNKFRDGDRTRFSFNRFSLWGRHCDTRLAKITGKKSGNKGAVITYIFYVCPACLNVSYLYLKWFPKNKQLNLDYHLKLSGEEFNESLKKRTLASIALLKQTKANSTIEKSED